MLIKMNELGLTIHHRYQAVVLCVWKILLSLLLYLMSSKEISHALIPSSLSSSQMNKQEQKKNENGTRVQIERRCVFSSPPCVPRVVFFD